MIAEKDLEKPPYYTKRIMELYEAFGLERRKFAQSAHEYLIENVQSAYEFVNNSNYTYKIDFKHPCKELLFFFQKIAYRDDTTGKYTNDFNNFCVDNNKTISILLINILVIIMIDKYTINMKEIKYIDENREKEYLLPTANSSMSLTDDQKLAIIEKGAKAYEAFLDALRIDWRNDPNSAGTPRRVAKSFVYDLIAGCYNAPPKVTSFPI